MVEIATEKFYFVGEVMVQADVDEIIFERLWNAGAEPFGVGAVTHVGVIAEWHHVPKFLDSGADANAAGIAGLIAANGRTPWR